MLDRGVLRTQLLIASLVFLTSVCNFLFDGSKVKAFSKSRNAARCLPKEFRAVPRRLQDLTKVGRIKMADVQSSSAFKKFFNLTWA